MTRNSQAFALDVNESFLMRTMEKHHHTILHVIKRFRTLDVMIDQDDLLQEAFFGVRNAHHAWNDARAINMKFTTYLTWHVSRHFQGKFLGYDKIVDLIMAGGGVTREKGENAGAGKVSVAAVMSPVTPGRLMVL